MVTEDLQLRARNMGIPFRAVRGFTVFAASAAQMKDLAPSASGILVALNAEKLGRGDPELLPIVNANLGYPDGIGAVLALARKGVRARRVAGSDLWLQIVDACAGKHRIYLVGSTSTVVAETAARLRARHPRLELRFRDGYLAAGDQERLEDDLRSFQPRVVFVAMGSPRQEILMAALQQAHPALYMGLGGSFDVFVGEKPRAPRWLQSIGLEWAYQFARTPRRLVRLPSYLRFAWLLALGRI